MSLDFGPNRVNQTMTLWRSRRSKGQVSESSEIEGSDSNNFEDEHDEMYDQILSWTSEQKEISASLLQRKFRLGYPRAARILSFSKRKALAAPMAASRVR
jgi:S-DNA-T family DNA segregation ATPase FtsK/SpoIIIE